MSNVVGMNENLINGRSFLTIFVEFSHKQAKAIRNESQIIKNELMTEHIREHSSRVALRDRIIDTAMASFTTHGIKSITMDDIAASLGISKRTLYEVFQDKESLLVTCVIKKHEEMNDFLKEVHCKASNVLEVILMCYKRSIENFHKTNKLFFEDIKKYPKAYEALKNYRDKDSDNAIEFFRTGIEQGIFRDDVNFEIVNLLVREQLDMLMNTELCKEYSFLEVYESIMFTYIRGISTEKGSQVLEGFIKEYRKNKIYEENKR